MSAFLDIDAGHPDAIPNGSVHGPSILDVHARREPGRRAASRRQARSSDGSGIKSIAARSKRGHEFEQTVPRYVWAGSKARERDCMTLEEALTLIQQTRSFIGTIYSTEVVLDGKFKPQELEAILFVMRNRPAPPYETAQ